MKSARHKTANNVRIYQRDASTTFEIALESRNQEDNKVGRFRSIFLENGSSSTVSPSKPWQRHISVLANEWYKNYLGYENNPMTKLNCVSVLRHALDKVSPISDQEELKNSLEEHLSTQDTNIIPLIIQTCEAYTQSKLIEQQQSFMRQY